MPLKERKSCRDCLTWVKCFFLFEDGVEDAQRSCPYCGRHLTLTIREKGVKK